MTDSPTSRMTVSGTDVTYLPAQAPAAFPPALRSLTDRLGVRLIWASMIRRGDSTFTGMYCGPPHRLTLVDPAQAPEPDLAAALASATLVHECGHAAFTPASQEKHQTRAASLIRDDQERFLFDGLLDTLEDERVEGLIKQRWPDVAGHLGCRWQRVVNEGKILLEQGEFRDYGPAQALAIARLDYVYRMLGESNWYKKADWQQLPPRSKSFLSQLRRHKRAHLRPDGPSEVPALALQILVTAKERR